MRIVMGGPRTLLLVSILVVLFSFALQLAAGQEENAKYLIASVPALKQIHYAKLGDPVMRALLVTGLSEPKAIAVDGSNNRLFVADKVHQKIFWYQLIATEGGRLITDGKQHVALTDVQANGMATDGAGNLYYTGTNVPPPGQISSGESVYRHAAVALATTGSTTSSELLWNQRNTGPAPAKVATPSGIATNGFDVFWGNYADAKTHASVARAPAAPQSVTPNLQVKTMADNADSVRGVVLTPKFVYYATGDNGQVFGISMSRQGPCGVECKTIVSAGKLTEPTGMVWDGDGTVFVADSKTGKVYSFPSGNLAEHELLEVVSATDPLHDIGLLQVPMGAAPSGGFLGESSSLLGAASRRAVTLLGMYVLLSCLVVVAPAL